MCHAKEMFLMPAIKNQTSLKCQKVLALKNKTCSVKFYHNIHKFVTAIKHI